VTRHERREQRSRAFTLDPDPNKQFSKIEQDSLFQDGKLHPSITVIGNNVSIPGEVVVLNAIVLPHKELGSSSKNQIIL
jgi:mannose-1-phosphate guanylyltransferase